MSPLKSDKCSNDFGEYPIHCSLYKSFNTADRRSHSSGNDMNMMEESGGSKDKSKDKDNVEEVLKIAGLIENE